ERFEKLARLLVPGQRSPEIVRDLCRALRRIGSTPPAVLLRPFDLLRACGEHATHVDQMKRAGAISFGPFAGLTARCESHERILIIKATERAVDPAVTQRDVDSFRL